MTWFGRCEVAPLSRYTSGCPLIMRDRIGKSALTFATSTAASLLRADGLGAQAHLGTDALVALRLEFLSELLAALLHDTTVDHHVNEVGCDVVQDPLVVRDQQHPEIRTDQLSH